MRPVDYEILEFYDHHDILLTSKVIADAFTSSGDETDSTLDDFLEFIISDRSRWQIACQEKLSNISLGENARRRRVTAVG